MIISKTSFRCTLSGGSTDFKSFYSRYGSFLVNFAIDKHFYIGVRETSPFQKYKTSVYYSQTECVNDNKDIKLPGVRGVLEYLNIDRGLEINLSPDLPKMTGTGSSSACIVGLLKALTHLEKKEYDKKWLAKSCNIIEREILQEFGGQQDPYPCAMGGLISIEINKNGEAKVKPVPVCNEFIKEFEESLVMFYTGSSRQSFQIAKSIDNPLADEYKLNILSLSNQLYSELCNENISRVGECLHENWISKKKISNQISNSDVDILYDNLRQQGVIGGKIMGSGGQGFILCVVPKHLRQSIIDNTTNISMCPKIDFEGSRIVSS